MFFQDGDESKKGKKIPHHGPKPISIICHLSNTLLTHSSLPLRLRKKCEVSFLKLSKNVKNFSRLPRSFYGNTYLFSL
jgi:hypothetical protein